MKPDYVAHTPEYASWLNKPQHPHGYRIGAPVIGAAVRRISMLLFVLCLIGAVLYGVLR